MSLHYSKVLNCQTGTSNATKKAKTTFISQNIDATREYNSLVPRVPISTNTASNSIGNESCVDIAKDDETILERSEASAKVINHQNNDCYEEEDESGIYQLIRF